MLYCCIVASRRAPRVWFARGQQHSRSWRAFAAFCVQSSPPSSLVFACWLCPTQQRCRRRRFERFVWHIMSFSSPTTHARGRLPANRSLQVHAHVAVGGAAGGPGRGVRAAAEATTQRHLRRQRAPRQQGAGGRDGQVWWCAQYLFFGRVSLFRRSESNSLGGPVCARRALS